MKYRADKIYPDLDPSEPIPEIEVRYDAFKREFMRLAIPIVILTIVSVIVLVVVFSTRNLSFVPMVAMTLAVLGLLVLPQVLAFARMPKDDRNRLIYQNKTDPWGIPVRQQVLYQSYYFGMIMVLVNLPSLTGGFSAFEYLIGFYLIIGGVCFVVMTRFMRQPGQISCEKCSYPLVGLTLPCECPECGIALRDLSYTTDRPRVRDSRYLFAGIILTLVGVVVSYTMIKHKGLIYNAIPKGTLITLAPNSTDAFEALERKTLTPAEEDRLKDAMIDTIASGNTDGFWTHCQGSWLAQRAFNDGLTQAQLDRMLDPFTQAWIDAPGRVRVGTPIILRVGAPEGYNPDHRLDPDAYFGGFVIADDPTAHERQSTRQSRDRLVEGSGPSMVWIPDSPGVVIVRARLVWVLDPNITKLDQFGLSWNPDGTHSFENPPVWERIVEIEHTIEVVD
tara:strand:+ start:44 stop:1387 length:1344 start_codon:yes stop_codon:yes gene_type:complete